MARYPVSLHINGIKYECEVDTAATLLQFIRDEAGLTGTKPGCENGECGACTVLMDGEAINSCQQLAIDAQGKEILTIEGMADKNTGKLHPIQEAYADSGAVQCGFCTPGMIMSTKALLDKNPDPTEEEIKYALSGNLCRCTGYYQIIEAVQSAAKVMNAEGGETLE